MAELIMQEEGYASVTTRRLALRTGVSNKLVHYYFHSMDDLFIALMERNSVRNLERIDKALSSEDPLAAFWQLLTDVNTVGSGLEYMAMTNHRKEIRAAAAKHSIQARALEVEAWTRILTERGVDLKKFPPAGVAVILSSLARIIAMEASVGMAAGHSEAAVLARGWLSSLQQSGRPRAQS
jgi:AcrR family transcriptional regulator